VGLGGKDKYDKKSPIFHAQLGGGAENHSYTDILKIDIEASEHGALDTLMDSCGAAGIMPIGQVMIEPHLADDQHINFERFMKWLERLEGFGMRPTCLP
jgi:hypothetical protein